jgi:hypothetical protein
MQARPPFAESIEGEEFATRDPDLRARETLVHVLPNHNDLVTI